LGNVPTLAQLLRERKITREKIREIFGGYRACLEACGLERRRGGFRLTLNELFLDWAALVRKLGKVPNITEYNRYGKYTSNPVVKFLGGWRHVPAGMLQFAREQELETEWRDVLELVTQFLESKATRGKAPRTDAAKRTDAPLAKPRILEDQPFYGAPLLPTPFGMAPTNEMGVIFLFGAVARELGFMMLRLQIRFPDGEAFREVEPGRWQRVRIEFEFESRNFITHMHPVNGCELIVCWNHNWPECPLEVIELKTVVSNLKSYGPGATL
jgi:hypothetical protein